MVGDEEAKVRIERARAVGMFRYELIREAADAGLSRQQRGQMVRVLASQDHIGPFGKQVRISR
jgi:putative transposase